MEQELTPEGLAELAQEGLAQGLLAAQKEQVLKQQLLGQQALAQREPPGTLTAAGPEPGALAGAGPLKTGPGPQQLRGRTAQVGQRPQAPEAGQPAG